MKDWQKQNSSFVGGVEHKNNNGIWAMELSGDTNVADNSFKKSIFFFGTNEVINLGSGINNFNTENTLTTLFQLRMLSTVTEPIEVNGSSLNTFPYSNNSLTGNATLKDSHGNGYYIPNAENLVIERSAQNSYDIHSNNGTSGNWSKAYFNHGGSPANAGYEYAILIQADNSEISAYATSTPYEVLQKDAFAHIVKHNASNKTGYAIFDAANSLPLNTGVLQQVSLPVMLMLEEVDNAHIDISIANPELVVSGQTVSFTLRGHWNSLNSFTELQAVTLNNDFTTTVTIDSKEGKSYSLNMEEVVNAPSVYYLSPDGLDSNNGLSWATAKKNFIGAFNAARDNVANCMVWAKAGTYVNTGAINMNGGTNDKIYGGFVGNEVPGADAEAVIAAREKSDIDGNGLIEPWEFTNPSILVTNRNDKAIENLNSGTIIDGFTMTHTANVTSHISLAQVDIRATGTVQNCIITGGSWTQTAQAINSSNGIIKVEGTLKNCLIENNTLSITATGTGNYKTYGLISTSATSTDAVVDGNIVRNNQITLNQSGTSAIADNTNFRGAIYTASSTIDTFNHILTNNIFHNNEVTYIGSVDKPEGTYVAMFSNLAFSTTQGPIIYKHNLIANNKTTNCLGGAIYLKHSDLMLFTLQNNAIWNNQNEGTASSSITASFRLLQASNISNNISDTDHVGSTYFSDNATYVGNQTDLSTLNIGAKAPMFTTPSTVIGYSTDESVALSNWTITDDSSYLFAAGVDAGLVNDRIGNPFGITPTVGPYEVESSLSNNEITNDVSSLLTIYSNGFMSTQDAFVRVITLTGQVLKTINVRAGQYVSIKYTGICVLQYRTATTSGAVKAFF